MSSISLYQRLGFAVVFVVALLVVGCSSDDGDDQNTPNNLTGDTLWTRTYGSVEAEYCFTVLPTEDGGFLLGGGRFTSNVQQPFIVKVDGNGSQEWTRAFTDSVSIYSIAKASDGGYIMVGHNGLGKTKLIKTDSQCIRLWARAFDLGDPWAIVALPDGGYVFGGGGANCALLIRTNSQGDTLWTRTFFDGTSARFTGIADAGNGSVVACGLTVGAEGWCMKVDVSGNQVWVQQYSDNFVHGLASINGGDYVLVGDNGIESNRQLALARINSSGGVVWSHSFGGTGYDNGFNVVQASDGSLVVAGRTKSFGQGVPDQPNLWVLHTNSLGDSLWSRVFGGSGYDSGWAIARASDGVIVAGETDSWGAGLGDFYVVKLE